MATQLEIDGIELFDKYRDVGFTSSDRKKQIAKLLEEVGEFVEAILEEDHMHMLEEAGDVAWMLVDMLHVAGSPYSLTVGMMGVLDKLKERVRKNQ